MIDEYYTFKIFGYHSDELKPRSRKLVVSVCDGCYKYRVQSMYNYRDLCGSCASKNMRQSKTVPLPNGWKSKLSDITTNKKSPVYLGRVAETILSHIYKDVQVMPYGNHGYDVICNRDFLIDIKSSATGDKYGYWKFTINHNQIADYFLCLAFNNRDDLHIPAHLWLIPGHVVNHLQGLKIRKSTINKWQPYELSLDNLRECCDNLSV